MKYTSDIVMAVDMQTTSIICWLEPMTGEWDFKVTTSPWESFLNIAYILNTKNANSMDNL